MKDRLIAWGPAAAWAGVLFFLSALPGKDHPPYLFAGEDKVAHLVFYGVLGAALAWGRHRGRDVGVGGGDRPPSPALLLGVGILYAISDEVHQAFVPGRDVSLGDLAADAVGVALGYGLFTRFLGRRAKRASASTTL